MLRSEQNTQEIRQEIEKLVSEKFPNTRTDVFFEHGHWWARVTDENFVTTYDVLDTENSSGKDLFDLELLEQIVL